MPAACIAMDASTSSKSRWQDSPECKRSRPITPPRWSRSPSIRPPRASTRFARPSSKQGYRFVSLDEPRRRRSTFEKLAGLIIGVAGILLIILFDTEWISHGGAPDISQHMSLYLIFVLGLLTGFHCIGMCGGFVLSYTADDARAGRRSYVSHLLYGAGKTLSYTTIGAMFGLLGAVVAFTPLLRGVAGMMAGAFLIVFGLNMLGLFAPLRRFRLGLPTPLQTFIARQTYSQHRPFVIGLLNGLMIACGPLQAMYVMAAGTGSAFEGAKMLFAFGVGTLPVLMSFGVLTTLISGSLTHRLLKASGVIVVVLGAVMINRGLILTGSGYDLRSIVGALSRMSKPSPQPSPEFPVTRASRAITTDVLISDDNATDAHAASAAGFPNDHDGGDPFWLFAEPFRPQQGRAGPLDHQRQADHHLQPSDHRAEPEFGIRREKRPADHRIHAR